MPAGGGKTKEDTWKSSELEKQLQDAKGEKVRKSTKTSESADRRDRRRNDEGEGKDRDRGDRERKHRDEDDKEKKHRREVDDREKRHHREDAEKDRKHHREDIEREHRTRREDDERRHQKEDGEREHRTRREDGERRHHKEDGEREHRTRREDGDKSRSSKHDSEAVNDKKSQRRHDDDSNRATNDSEAKKHRSKAEISEKESSTRVRDSDGHRRRSDKEEGEKSKSSKDRPSGSTAEARDDDRRRRRNEDGGSEDRRHKQRDDGQKSRDREEKRRDKNSDRDGRDSEAKPHRSRDGNEESKHRKSEPVKDNDRHKAKVQPPEEDNYEDDFENYEDDFDNDNASDDSYEKKPAKSRGHAFGGSQGNREMDEILRAMSEENNRLLSASEKSHKKKAHVPEPSERTDSSHSAASFIDFGSAKRRNLMGRTAGRLQGRAKDLFDIIELENVSHSLFEHHPTNEYELFIQSFGKSNCTQTSVQTNDDTIDRDIQTDDVSLKDKWTQHPAGVDVAAFGGDIGTDASETADSFVDTVTLSKFICKAGRVIALLLEENAMDYIRNDSRSQQSKIIVSEAFTELGPVSVLKDRYCIYSQFSAVQSQLLLAAYSDCTAGNQNRSVWDKGIVCVWNVYESAAPQKILVCHVKPTCCCFSPSKPTLAFAGLVDGSLVVWDLLEVSSQHKQVKDNNTGEEYCLRQPTYNTAGVLHSDNHQSCVISIVPITSSSSESVNTSSTSSVGSAFQLASLDADSVVNLWIVADLGDNDAAGSVSDLGLRPTGQVKLVKSSSILLQNPSRQVHSRFSSFDLRVLPANNNHFFVATDSGCIIHGNRLGGKVSPKSYWPQTEMSIKVTSVDFSPFSEPVFLAGYDDGSLRLYHIDCDQPLMTWLEATNSGNSVKSVHWCRSRPSVFFVLDSNSCIYIWDLNMDQASALKCECITRDSSVTSLCLSNDYSATGQGLPGRPPQMVVFMQNGTAEAHIIKKQFSALMADEVDKFSALIQIMSA